MTSIHQISPAVKAVSRLITCMLVVAAAGISCTRELPESGPIHLPVTDREVNFSVRVPSAPAAPKSRALTGPEENYISSLYVLSFLIDPDNNETFDYWTEATEKQGNNNGAVTQYYSATLKVRNQQQRLVLLTNVSETTRTDIAGGNWKGTDKYTMLAALSEDVLASDFKWNAASPSDYRALPMWGESLPQTIDNNTSGLSGTIPLLRMVATIDVQLDEGNNELFGKFILTSVRLYNTNYKGSLVPAPENILESTSGNVRRVWVNAPTIPADIAGYNKRYRGPVTYEDFSPPGEYGIAMRRAIYLFEAASTMEHPEATCVVIGGYYGTDSSETYYRVDFVEDDGATRLNILRNHRYTIHIKDINISGYSDPEDAFNSRGENISASIIEWDEANINEVIFNGQYYYSVGPTSIEHSGSAQSGNKIFVKTDYPEWSFGLSDSSEPGDAPAGPDQIDWVTVTSHTAGDKYPGEGTTKSILYDIAENKEPERTAYIHVTAGQTTITVVIRQTNREDLSFTFEPEGEIWGPGEMRMVKAAGTFESIDVRARDLTNGEFTVTGTITKNQNDDAVGLFIPPFKPTDNQYDTRTVAFEYYDPETSNWEIIRTDDQRNILYFVTMTHRSGDPFWRYGDSCYVEVRGEFPTLYIRSSSEGITVEESSPIQAGRAEKNDPAVGTVRIPGNPGARGRIVDLQYSTDGIEWITISSGYQPTNHLLIEDTGRILARDQLSERMSWDQAMGISGYIYSYFYTTYGNDDSNRYYDPTPGVETGCAGYYEREDASDKGLWRLPVFTEVFGMAVYADMIDNPLPQRASFWSSGETSPGEAFYADFPYDPNSIGAGYYAKTVKLYVRCAREPDEAE